ncbi:hypothetical protein [Cytobacillus gottheilii]|uniref:hypothetical protein n=1 Tax=Cytobacillus gottheilii TaxID=859144 RepID=UPI0024940466|nr:hypothetical protein [Cytobacillus gottheilii]
MKGNLKKKATKGEVAKTNVNVVRNEVQNFRSIAIAGSAKIVLSMQMIFQMNIDLNFVPNVHKLTSFRL